MEMDTRDQTPAEISRLIDEQIVPKLESLLGKHQGSIYRLNSELSRAEDAKELLANRRATCRKRSQP